MIKISDTNKLVFAKFHGHKIRTIFTTLMLGLILGGLVAGSIISTGVINTVKKYNAESLSGRYFVSVDRYNSTREAYNNVFARMSGDLLFDAKNRFNNLVEQKKAYAKQLGIQYDEEYDMEKPYTTDYNNVEALNVFMYENKIVRDVLVDNLYQENVEAYDYSALLDEKAEQHGVIQKIATNINMENNGSKLTAWRDGVESFENNASSFNHAEKEYLINENYTTISGDLLRSFIFENNTWSPENHTIPVVLSQLHVEDLLGIREDDYDKTNIGEIIKRYEDVRERAVGLRYTMCYRNSASIKLISRVGQQKEEEKYYASKGIKYNAPSLVYDYPDPKSCAAPVLVKDNRSWYEKNMDEKQQKFDERFGLYEAPESYNLEFEVVGMIPSRGIDLNTSMFGVFVDLASFDLDDQYVLNDYAGQDNYFQKDENERKYDIALYGSARNDYVSYEFSSVEDANAFMDDVMSSFEDEPPFNLGFSSINKSAAIDDIRNFINNIVFIAIIIFAVIEVIVIWLSVGRTIADSRKETAIMRALGFKRLEICQVYVLFTFVQLLFIVAFAAIVAASCVAIVSNMFGADFVDFVKYVFYARGDVEVSFIGVDVMQVVVICCSLLVGFVGIIFPLVRNIRRNPVNDLRSE